MSKLKRSKTTAKLMLEKLSPQELEFVLYNLLILLPNDELINEYNSIKSK